MEDAVKVPIVGYCLYARKSSEDDERQAMSIDSQVKEMTDLAQKEGIIIKEIRRESHSAKESGQRSEFNRLIQNLREGVFTGILTWAPDRLSRNAGDLGMLVDLMDQGKLVNIKTFTQAFTNSPSDKFLLMILCSQAKLENDQKGVNVKRGIRAKCEMGWRPGVAPMGYMNRAFGGVKDIIIDPERAPLIKETFERVAYRSYSGRKAKEWLDENGFVSKSGKKMSLSKLYLMLRNPFYYGHYKYGTAWYKGSHEPLISKDVFDEAQKELDERFRPKVWGKSDFPYKGIFSCYNCNTSICGEEKYRKRIDGIVNHHVYYHCTRSRNPYCREPYITEKDLVRLIKQNIQNLREEVLKENISPNLTSILNQYQPIVEEIEFYKKDDIEYDGKVSFKDIIIYASAKSPIAIRRELLQNLPIPKKLHNLQLV